MWWHGGCRNGHFLTLDPRKRTDHVTGPKLSGAEPLRGFLASSNFCWSFSPQCHLIIGYKILKKDLPGSCGSKNPRYTIHCTYRATRHELSPHWRGRITRQIKTWIPETDCLGLNLAYVVWLWASEFSSLFSSFFTCQVRRTVLSTSKVCEGIEWVNILSALRTVLGISKHNGMLSSLPWLQLPTATTTTNPRR